MELPLGIRDLNTLKKEKFNDERISTVTSREQMNTESSVEKCFDRFRQLFSLNHSLLNIHREQHIRYLENSLRRLSTAYECLDSSRPWLVYWILNSAHLLNFKFQDELLDQTVDFLVKCRDKNGGFGGGPGQRAHLAPTYAAVNSLCIIGTEKAYKAIDRESLKEFFKAVRKPDGAFCLHVDGEIDVRGAYCALSCAKLANFSQEDEDELFDGTAEWMATCQTYEGGFGGAPGLEAHGGYTFCGLAGLVMLGKAEICDLELLLKWALARQMRFEGGFQGRTNKLVDGCYSFWVGAIFPIIQAVMAKADPSVAQLLKTPLFDRCALQEYILLCCQKTNGGLIDKPGKPQDLYHTCYTLSGVSISQHCELNMEPLILGPPSNELDPVHPLHNIPPYAVMRAFAYINRNCKDTCNLEEDEQQSEESLQKTDQDQSEREASADTANFDGDEEDFSWNTTSS